MNSYFVLLLFLSMIYIFFDLLLNTCDYQLQNNVMLDNFYYLKRFFFLNLKLSLTKHDGI